MKIAKSQKEAEAMNPEHIFKDAEDSYRCYFPGEIVRPVAAPDTRSEIVKEIASSPALTALTDELAKLKGVTKDALVVSLDPAAMVAK